MKTYRRRYVLFRLLSEDNGAIDDKQIADAIRHSLLSLFGEIIVAESRLYVQAFDNNTGFGVLQVSQQALEKTLAAAALIRSIGDVGVIFHPIRTSGTLRALLRKVSIELQV